MIPELSQLNYEERLCGTNPLCLEMRTLEVNLMEVIEIVNGIGNTDQCSFIQPSSGTRTKVRSFFTQQ